MRSNATLSRTVKALAAMSVVVSMGLSSVAASAATPKAKQANAAAKIRYKASIVAPSPASDFTFSGGGDGWDLAFSGTQFFNAYHHDGNFEIDCHQKATGDVCPGFPKTIIDDNGTGFSTGGKPGLYYDKANGNLYSFSVRQDGHVGVLCVDPRTSSKYCGFTDFGSVTDGSMSPSNGVVVGSEYYAFVYQNNNDTSTSSGPNNHLLCFDITTHDACGTPIYSVALPASLASDSWPFPGISAVGGRVMVNLTNYNPGAMTCFDPSTHATCSGSWPLENLSSNAGVPPMPVLSTTGAPIGVCQESTNNCFDFTGATISVPSAITNAVPGGTPWQGASVVLGTRVYLPVGGYDNVYCVDFATGDVCPNFPVNVGNSGTNYLYTVAWDPASPGCIWVSADGGNRKITNFDATTGGKCAASGATIAEGDVVAPSLACTDITWDGLYMSDPGGGTFDGGKVTIKDSTGNPSGITDQTFGADGHVDLSAVAGQMPDGARFTIELTNPVAVKVLTVEFDWLGAGLNTCQLVPSAPSASIDGDLGTKNVTVNWTTPERDGIARNPNDLRGSNISGYVVSLRGPSGELYICKTAALTCTFKARKVLRGGQNFSASVVAISNVGKSEPGVASTDLQGPAARPVLDSVTPSVGAAVLNYHTAADSGGSDCCYYTQQIRLQGDSTWSDVWAYSRDWNSTLNAAATRTAGDLDPANTYEVRIAEEFYNYAKGAWEWKYSNSMTVKSIDTSLDAPIVSGILSTSVLNGGVVYATAKQASAAQLPATSYEIHLVDGDGNDLGNCVAESGNPGEPLPVGTCQISTSGNGPFSLIATATNGVVTSAAGEANVEVTGFPTVLKRGTVGVWAQYKLVAKNAKLVAGTFPAGMSFRKGLLVGTPQVASPASTPYIFKVSGGGSTETYLLNVDPTTVQLTAPKDTLLVVGDALQPWLSFGPTDAATPELTFELDPNAGNLPNGVTLEPNGQLSGTPTEAGAFPIRVCGTDATGSYTGCASYTMTIGTLDANGQFVMPAIKWQFFGKAKGTIDGNGNQVLNLTPDQPNVGGSAALPIPLNVSDFTVSANLDFGTDGDGIALALVDPATRDLLGSAGGQLGLNGLVGAAVTWDTHQNKNQGDPSNNFLGIATQRAQGRFTYADTLVIPRSGATLLQGVHAVSAHFQQTQNGWHVTSVLDDSSTLEADIPSDAINPTSLLVFTSSNGTHQGIHAASDVSITTPTNTALCQVRDAAAPLKVYTSLQEAADSNDVGWGATLAVSGTCAGFSTGKALTLGGVGQNASIVGQVTLGNGQGYTFTGLHLSNPDGLALLQYDGDVTLNNVVVEGSGMGISNYGGQMNLNGSQVLNNGIPGQGYGCGGLEVHGTTYLNNSLVSGNTADGAYQGRGAGICVMGGSFYSNGSIITHNTMLNGSGGGMSIDNWGWVQLRNTTVAHNSASGDGAGIYGTYSSNGDLGSNGDGDRNRFYQNQAGGTGGAVYTQNIMYICSNSGAPNFVGNLDGNGNGGWVTYSYGGTVASGTQDVVVWNGSNVGADALHSMWNWCD